MNKEPLETEAATIEPFTDANEQNHIIQANWTR